MTVRIEPIVIKPKGFYDDSPIVIENLTLLAMRRGQTAITIEFPDSPSCAQTSVFIRNVCIKPGAYGWENGIDLINCWFPDISGVNVYGGQLNDPDKGGGLQNGIILDGTTMDARLHRCTIVHPVTGILIAGQCEGPTISDCRVLGGINGVVASTELQESGIWISDSHFNVSRAGVILVNRPEAFLSNLLVYQHPWRAGKPFDTVVTNMPKDTYMTNVVTRFPFGGAVGQ